MDEPSNVFHVTDADPSDFGSFERFRLNDENEQYPYVLGERIIPNATRSGASILTHTRFWEADAFAGSNAPGEAKQAFLAFMNNRTK